VKRGGGNAKWLGKIMELVAFPDFCLGFIVECYLIWSGFLHRHRASRIELRGTRYEPSSSGKSRRFSQNLFAFRIKFSIILNKLYTEYVNK